MKEQVKKLYCKITAAVMAVLMIVLVIASLGPVITIRMADVGLNEEYATGRYTSGMVISEVDIGVGTGLGYLKNAKYVNAVVSIQGKDTQIAINQEYRADVQEALAKAYINDASESTINGYKDSIKRYDEIIKEYQDEIAAILAEFTPEELEKFDALTHDEAFIEQVGLWYGTLSLFSDVDFEQKFPEYTENIVFIIGFVLGLICFIILVIIAVVFAVIFVIGTVIKLIRVAVSIGGANDKLLESLYAKTLPGYAGFALALVLLLTVFQGYAVKVGSGLVGLIVCYIIFNAIRGINKILLADKIDSSELVKYAITVVAVILFACILVSFLGFGAYDSIMEDGPVFMGKYYAAQYEVELQKYNDACPYSQDNLEELANYLSYMADGPSVASSRTKNLVNEAFKNTALIALAYDAVTCFIVFIGFVCFVERLGSKTTKNKYTQIEKSYGAMPAFGILLVICFLVPNFLFTAPTLTDKDAAFEKGEYKIQLDDYKVENAPDYIAYNLTVEAQKATSEAVTKLQGEYDAATDETVKTQLGYTLGTSERTLELIESGIDMYETSEKSALTMGVVLSVLLAATSFVYMFAVAPVAKLLDGVFGKKESSDEAPADDAAPADEAEAPADEAAPAEENDAKEE